MAPPEEWVDQLVSLNSKESRSAAVQAYLSQLALIITGAGFHCGHTPGFDGGLDALATCLQTYRVGHGGHRSWGVSMAGLARVLSIVRMVEDIGKRQLNGSYAEMGVWRGGMTVVATAALQLHGMPTRPVYLCDSFQGLPLPRKGSFRARSDAFYHRDKLLSVGVQSVLANFDRYGVPRGRVEPIVGYFVDSIPRLRTALLARGERLAILRLDGDIYDSTVDVLYNMYDLLLPGGYVVVDDFVWPKDLKSAYGARDVVMDFRAVHGIEEDDMAGMRDIDGPGAYWVKTKEVDLQRERYLASLANRSQVALPPLGERFKSSWRGAQSHMVQLGKHWQSTWSAQERAASDAISDAECNDGGMAL